MLGAKYDVMWCFEILVYPTCEPENVWPKSFLTRAVKQIRCAFCAFQKFIIYRFSAKLPSTTRTAKSAPTTTSSHSRRPCSLYSAAPPGRIGRRWCCPASTATQSSATRRPKKAQTLCVALPFPTHISSPSTLSALSLSSIYLWRSSWTILII